MLNALTLLYSEKNKYHQCAISAVNGYKTLGWHYIMSPDIFSLHINTGHSGHSGGQSWTSVTDTDQ